MNRPIIHTIIAILFGGMLLASCQKEKISSDSDSDGMNEIKVHFAVAQGASTKAHSISEVAIDDIMQRIDMYLFYKNHPEENRHITLFPEEGVIPSLTFKERTGTQIALLALGNLDEDTAKYLESASQDDMYQINTPEGRIVLEAGNFSFDKIPMLGNTLLYFYSDHSVSMDMYRLMYRLDIENIVIDFDDKELLGKEVKLKNIAIINTMNFLSPIRSTSIFYESMYWTLYYEDNYLRNAFGGVEQGFDYNRSGYSGYSKILPPVTYHGPGKLDGRVYKDCLNANYKNGPGELNIDASGPMLEATYHHYDAGEGLIVSEGDMQLKHTFKIDKCMYGLFWNVYFGSNDIICNYDDQFIDQKLVFELQIGEKTYFYPIRLYRIQPNTVYKIQNVTIKNVGSRYANFYEKKYALSLDVSVQPWDEIEINNIGVGVDPHTGKPVDDENLATS